MPTLDLSPAQLRAFRSGLLRHFDQHKRDMPWRRTRDPYRIWVSEVMLQQTRVDTVKPYYERWMNRFPDVQALAVAPVDEVLKAWEGLGYYSRARNLHAAARLVREQHNGQLPGTYAALRELPGIGDYTAGAVASVAFAQPEPVVDGNVSRVLHRLCDEPRMSARELRAQAAALVAPDRPGDFNQAMMELGSIVCTPRAPRCDVCPVRDWCRAFARGTQLERPAPKPPKAIPHREFTVVVLRNAKGEVLLRKRPPKGLLAGLWEFPELERLADFRLTLKEHGTVAHVFSHFRATYHVVSAATRRTRLSAPDLEWFTNAEIRALALPTAQRRIGQLVLVSA